MNKNVFKAMWLSVMAVAVVTVSSCSSDDFFEFDNYRLSENSFLDSKQVNLFYNDIIESKEFKNYMLAKEAFGNLFSPKNIQKLQNQYIDSLNMFKINYMNEQLALDNALSALIIKYPIYQKMSDNEKNELVHRYLMTYDEQYSSQYIAKKQICRAGKNRNPEPSIAHEFASRVNIPRYSLTAHIFVSDAINECKDYSHVHRVESGGLGFFDGSGVFVEDANATDSTMSLPVVTGWSEGTPEYGFHYHFESDQLSGTDIESANNYGFPIYVIFDGYFLTR
jgi:hypothetical protein